MHLHYSHSKDGNFGDDLNPWLWPQLLAGYLKPDDGVALVGIGTLLSHKEFERFLKGYRKLVIFSSGTGDKEDLPTPDERWQFYCVRGPHTAENMGLAPEYGVVDGAYLLRTLALPRPDKRYKVSFMPHHRSEDYVDWAAVCERAGIHFISAKQQVEKILEELLATEVLVTEAMHGAIVADALRVPWVAVRYSPSFSLAKWRDFAAAVSLAVDPIQLPQIYQKRRSWGRTLENQCKGFLARLGVGPRKWKSLAAPLRTDPARAVEALAAALLDASGHTPQLSDDAVVEAQTAKLQECLARLKRDYDAGRL